MKNVHRVAIWVCEQIAQNVARPNFCPKKYITFPVEKKSPATLGPFCNFQKSVQRKQSLIRRKLAQSGHPECAWLFGCMYSLHLNRVTIKTDNKGEWLSTTWVCTYEKALYRYLNIAPKTAIYFLQTKRKQHLFHLLKTFLKSGNINLELYGLDTRRLLFDIRGRWNRYTYYFFLCLYCGLR
jgi:hypothetical protein